MSLLEIDKFVQNFVQKCVQVIVQSRLGTSKRTQTRCDPHGRDWFYLDIPDLQDITEQTAKCLKLINSSAAASSNTTTTTTSHNKSSSSNSSSTTSQQSVNLQNSQCLVRKSWKICCEISLRNSDGISLVLEYWIFSNVPVGANSTNSSNSTSNSEATNNSAQQQTVYQLLNRMSGMIKSLITLSRSTPAYKVSSKGQSADSYVICYRVYPCDEALIATATMDTVSSGGTTVPSVFSSTKPLGAIKSFANELSISLIYRTSMSMNSAEEDQAVNSNNILAALDGGRNCDRSNGENLLLPLKDDHFKSVDREAAVAGAKNDYEQLGTISDKLLDVTELFKPLNPAFASFQKDSLDDLSSGTPFSALLPGKDGEEEEAAAEVVSITSTHNPLDSDSKENEAPRRNNGSNSRTSAPISIPPANSRGIFSSSPKSSAAAAATIFSKSPQNATGNVYSTSNDSFVFVELNAPFASDDREFGSFFHGPSPTFVSNPSLNEESGESSEIINELSQQLAELESNAPQFDSFVESICITESQELTYEA